MHIMRLFISDFCMSTNTQEDVEPYYEAYSCLAKALNHDEQFKVELYHCNLWKCTYMYVLKSTRSALCGIYI